MIQASSLFDSTVFVQMFARQNFNPDTGFGDEGDDRVPGTPNMTAAQGGGQAPSTLFGPVLEQWDLPPAVKSAFSTALGLDGNEHIEDVKAIPADTISKVLSELLVESSSGAVLASPIVQGKVRQLWLELGTSQSVAARAHPSQATLALPMPGFADSSTSAPNLPVMVQLPDEDGSSLSFTKVMSRAIP